MNQRNLTKYVVAFLIFFMATSCSKENSSNLPVTENFKALVMGGKDIDPNQTWSTASNIPVTISVDFLSGSKYTIYIYQSHPASDNNITYLGMTTIVSGESKTIYVAKPADVSQLFAACYDDQQHVICVPIVNGQAKFSGKISTSTTMPTITTGNNWSVPTQSMPDLSKYTTGTLTEASELSPDLADDVEARLKISDSYTGFIPFLGTHSNMSVYVTSTWTLTYDQRINAGNVIVVGNGGKIIVPKGFKLTTTPLGESTVMGRIYVMPGGEISGDGIVEFSCEASGCNYNEGHLTTGEVSIVSGTLYNTGIIGDNVTPTTKLVGSAVNESSAKFVNLASAYFSEVNASTLSILNGGVIRVSDNLTLGQNARMDDGSSLSCGSLTLQGNGSNVLYMGNAAELNCSGRISVSNFGVWGPSGDKYVANARLRVGGCTQISASSGNASDFLLDHIQLEVPIGASGLDMLSGSPSEKKENITLSLEELYASLREASESHGVREDMWKKFDGLIEVIHEVNGFVLQNKIARRLEDYAISYFTSPLEATEVMDIVFANNFIHEAIITNRPQVYHTDYDLYKTIDNNFGPESLPLTRKVIKEYLDLFDKGGNRINEK